ncbi:hypothetical protein BC332_11368 [Capsicum chinense]|nr:hypothetical protein BC332_11368 [Capsicum chinense]
MEKPPDSASVSIAGESVNVYLCKLFDGLSAFQQCIGELHRHINFVWTSIDSSIRLLLPSPPTITTTPPAPALVSKLESKEEGEAKRKAEAEAKVETKGEQQLKSTRCSERKSASSELERLCETMSSKGLRKYMIRRISWVTTLRINVPKALKHSPNPAKLILQSIGNFYTQGRKAYVEGSPLINKRRLNLEGGVRQAQEIDARGLLLFIGCFGIPQAFKNEDINNLMQQSHIKMISGSLKRSSVLMAKIPETIKEMLKKNKVHLQMEPPHMEPETSNAQTLDHNVMNALVARLESLSRDVARVNATVEKLGVEVAEWKG